MFVFARLVRAPDWPERLLEVVEAKVRCRRASLLPRRCGRHTGRGAPSRGPSRGDEVGRDRRRRPHSLDALRGTTDSRSAMVLLPKVPPNPAVVSRLAGAVAFTDYAARQRDAHRTSRTTRRSCRARGRRRRRRARVGVRPRGGRRRSAARRTCGAAAPCSCCASPRRPSATRSSARRCPARARCSTSRGCRSGWRSSARR